MWPDARAFVELGPAVPAQDASGDGAMHPALVELVWLPQNVLGERVRTLVAGGGAFPARHWPRYHRVFEVFGYWFAASADARVVSEYRYAR